MICTDRFEVIAGPCTPIQWMQVEVMDLWRDDCGWSANCSWVRRFVVPVARDATDSAVSRKLKAVAGIQGMRADSWAGSDGFCWRDGCIGAVADVLYLSA